MSGPTRFDWRTWARWLATFVGFPLAGLTAKAIGGSIDTTAAALLGGLAGGLVLGGVQSLALRLSGAGRLVWAVSTSVGLAAGLGIGATAVDFRTDATSLMVMGLVSGTGVGVAQAIVMRSSAGAWPRATVWVATTAGLWALGWLITSQVIVDTDSQYATFGASGALVATALGGIVLCASPARRTASGTGTARHSTPAIDPTTTTNPQEQP
jgi:hypothetical protein